MMNPMTCVEAWMAVRGVWRQFHRRQVMPASSIQIGSPGSGYSTTVARPVGGRVERFVATTACVDTLAVLMLQPVRYIA